MQDIIRRSAIRGCVQAYQELPSGLRVPSMPWSHNLVVYEWGAIVSRLLAQGDIRYKISSIYLEFANSVADPIPVPFLDRTRKASYYHNLAGIYDYLSVPVRGAIIESSNSTLYPNGNQVVFTAKSGGEGLVGAAHDLPFGSSYNSHVIGAALVASVSETDATQDLVLSSFYFSTSPNEQQPKLAGSEIAIDWQLTLE